LRERGRGIGAGEKPEKESCISSKVPREKKKGGLVEERRGGDTVTPLPVEKGEGLSI